MRRRPPLLALSVALAGLIAAACGGDDDDSAPTPPPGGTTLQGVGCAWAGVAGGGAPRAPSDLDFVAFSGDFEGFRSWPSFTVPGAPDVSGVHFAGDRVVYINQVPPAGATEFAKGTMIVKATGGDDPKLFAMVKRGGDFNDSGALGWEWFEVKELQGDAFMDIEWRGVGPPDGENYAGNAEGGCNGCHAASPHDGVLSVGSCMP
jgi:hypothetical protein